MVLGFKFCSYVFVRNGEESLPQADKAEWTGNFAIGLSACGAKGAMARYSTVCL